MPIVLNNINFSRTITNLWEDWENSTQNFVLGFRMSKFYLHLPFLNNTNTTPAHCERYCTRSPLLLHPSGQSLLVALITAITLNFLFDFVPIVILKVARFIFKQQSTIELMTRNYYQFIQTIIIEQKNIG